MVFSREVLKKIIKTGEAIKDSTMFRNYYPVTFL